MFLYLNLSARLCTSPISQKLIKHKIQKPKQFFSVQECKLKKCNLASESKINNVLYYISSSVVKHYT